MPTPYRRNAQTPAGRISATPSTANWGGLRGLLSQYPGAAGAYSLRKIGSGPVVQLRRASDSVEKDFTAAELADGTAETWSSGGDAFVRYWYDQSGNGNNAGQSTAGEQPKLISSGSIINENSKPAMDVSSTSALKLVLNSALALGDFSIFFVTNFNAASGAILGTDVSGGDYVRARTTNTMRIKEGGTEKTFSNVDISNQGVFSVFRNGTAGNVFFDGSGSTDNPLTLPSGDLDLTQIADANGVAHHAGTIQEIIIYPSDQSANRVGIETNINDHYGIY